MDKIEQAQILNYISMAGHSFKFENYSRKQAIDKVYYLCRENGLKITRKAVTHLIDLEIEALKSPKDDFENKKMCWKAQEDYFFFNSKV
jgi:hypothetical protein